MASIVDERGYNQMFRPSRAQTVRLERRASAMVKEMTLPADLCCRAAIKIIELGCGSGELAHELAVQTGAHVVGADLSARFVAQAQSTHRHPGLSFVVADFTKEIPSTGADRYDYIVGNGILHHLFFDMETLLPALHRWLVPGGRLIFWEPNIMNPYIYSIFTVPALRKWAKLEPAEMAFGGSWIRQHLKTAGFDNVRVEPRDFLLPNIPSALIAPTIAVGAVLESIPGIRHLSQSLFITARAQAPMVPSI